MEIAKLDLRIRVHSQTMHYDAGFLMRCIATQKRNLGW